MNELAQTLLISWIMNWIIMTGINTNITINNIKHGCFFKYVYWIQWLCCCENIHSNSVKKQKKTYAGDSWLIRCVEVWYQKKISEHFRFGSKVVGKKKSTSGLVRRTIPSENVRSISLFTILAWTSLVCYEFGLVQSHGTFTAICKFVSQSIRFLTARDQRSHFTFFSM